MTSLWITVDQVPHISSDLEATGSSTCLRDITADSGRKHVILEQADTLRGETSADEKEDGG